VEVCGVKKTLDVAKSTGCYVSSAADSNLGLFVQKIVLLSKQFCLSGKNRIERNLKLK